MLFFNVKVEIVKFYIITSPQMIHASFYNKLFEGAHSVPIQYKNFFNQEVWEYSEQIFGHIPGTESLIK